MTGMSNSPHLPWVRKTGMDICAQIEVRHPGMENIVERSPTIFWSRGLNSTAGVGFAISNRIAVQGISPIPIIEGLFIMYKYHRAAWCCKTNSSCLMPLGEMFQLKDSNIWVQSNGINLIIYYQIMKPNQMLVTKVNQIANCYTDHTLLVSKCLFSIKN